MLYIMISFELFAKIVTIVIGIYTCRTLDINSTVVVVLLWSGVHCFMSMLSNYRIEENMKG